MGLFIDIHAIQTLPPANLNRDENGRPKTSIYGGVPRMRVSSQAWKKAIRDNFRDTLDTGRLGSRSREFTKMIAQRINRDPEDEHLLKVTGELMKAAGLPSDRTDPAALARSSSSVNSSGRSSPNMRKRHTAAPIRRSPSPPIVRTSRSCSTPTGASTSRSSDE